MVAQFKGGLHFVQGCAVMALGFFGAFLGVSLFTFLPVIARDVFHRDAGLYTQLVTFSGAGAVLGAAFVAWLGKNKHMGRTLPQSAGGTGAGRPDLHSAHPHR